jgi:hypothetical protein
MLTDAARAVAGESPCQHRARTGCDQPIQSFPEGTKRHELKEMLDQRAGAAHDSVATTC